MGVVLLSCVSPSGAELEESNKNPKKLDAMTLIKEGGSRHTLGLGLRADRTTFPFSTTTQEVADISVLREGSRDQVPRVFLRIPKDGAEGRRVGGRPALQLPLSAPRLFTELVRVQFTG